MTDQKPWYWNVKWAASEERHAGRYQLVTDIDATGFVCEVQTPIRAGKLDPIALAQRVELIASTPETARERDELREALTKLLERYVSLINCGDCGHWNPETEDEVIAARAALARSQ